MGRGARTLEGVVISPNPKPLPHVSLQGAQCVVTGANGFIGRCLCESLRSHGANVLAWRRDVTSKSPVDLLDPRSVDAALEHTTPDFVFHLAAVGTRHQAAHDPGVIADAVAMTHGLLTALQRRGARSHVVIAGSMAEYGAAGRLAETAPCRPATSYAIGKLASSLYALAYAPAMGLTVTVARLFGVYGPGEASERLFPTVIEHVRKRLLVPLSDGEQWRDFIHLDDTCLALMALATTRFEGIVNVGTGEAVRVRDVVESLCKQMGGDPSLLAFGSKARSPGDADRLEADVGLLKSVLGWAPPQRLTSSADYGRLFEYGNP